MNEMLVGSIAMGSFVIALFLLRFWRTTGDRLFLFFSASFFIEGWNRVLFWRLAGLSEEIEVYHLIRLLSYALILLAILDKNLVKRRRDRAKRGD